MIYGTFAGRLGRDADLKETPSGESVCNFSVAVDVRKNGEKTTNWIDAAVWGKRGKALHQYLLKGTPVVIVGEISVRQYTAKDGTPKAVLTCNVSQITLMGSASDAAKPVQDDGHGVMREHIARAKPAEPAKAAVATADFDDIEVPF